MIFCVYCHTNLSNNKKYFGITCQKPERRWRRGLGYKEGAFHRAIKKYGWNGFKHEILFNGLSELEAKAKEKELIAQYKTNNKHYGYNVTEGGDGTCGYKRPYEQRLAMSISRKGRHAGEKNPMYGRAKEKSPHYGVPMSEEAKRKASAKIIQRHKEGAFDKQKKGVIGYNEKEVIEFDSIADAAKAVSIPATNISRVCKGRRKTAAGYVWKYA